jgi:FkbM family methyltransferase
LLEHEAIDCIVDVGANKGQYGRFCREIGFSGLIISAEPDPLVHAELQAVAGSDRNWTTVCAAMSAQTGTMVFHRSRDSQFSSLLPPDPTALSQHGAGLSVVDEIQVPVNTVANLVQEYASRSRRIWLKTDTQGHDVQVLAGALSVLDRVRVIQAEVPKLRLYKDSLGFAETIEAIERLGFGVHALHAVNHDRAGLAVDFDCLFVRA